MSQFLPILTDHSPDQDVVWIIQAQYYYLDQFCLQAGLEPDSAVPLVFTLSPDRFSEARLTLPGAKCSSPEAWIKVLALLHLHHISFRIYQGTGTEDELSSLTQLRPGIDQELEGILGLAARTKVQELRRFQDLLDKAFALLEGMV